MEKEVTQIMPDNPSYIMRAQEAKVFRSSNFGEYLLDCAAEKAGNAAKALCHVDPTNIKRIIELQADARVLDLLNEFINKAIQTGDAEYANYQQKVDEDVENG